MKFAKFLAVMLITTLLVAGCSDEKSHFGGEGNDNSTEVGGGDDENTTGVGLLSVSGLGVDCRIDENAPDMGVEPLSAPTRSTRSSVDVNDFDCEIINEKKEVVMAFKFGQRPTEDIELLTGDYIFKIQSGEVTGAEWEAPIYGTLKPFKIVRNETTTLSEIVCSLMQIKVTVTYAPDLLERLGAKTLTTVKIGENFLEYALTESRAGFFPAPQVSNTIELQISGTYAADKENFKNINMTKEVQNVKAGQHSKIHFYLEHTGEGKINVGVTIRDWVTDEIIPCNVTDVVTEEEWVGDEDDDDDNPGGNGGGNTDGNDPSIVWDGHDISQRVKITDGLEVDLLVNASKGIKEFLVEIKSASLTPDELAGVGLCNMLNLCNPSQSYDTRNPGVFIDIEAPLRALGFSVGEDVVNKTFVKLSITQFMGILRDVSGTDLKDHDFIITVTDNAGNTTVATLMLQTGN